VSPPPPPRLTIPPNDILSLLPDAVLVSLPPVHFDEDVGTSVVEGDRRTLTLKSIPVPVTFGVFDGYFLSKQFAQKMAVDTHAFCTVSEHIFVDPTAEEEDVSSSSATVVFNDKGNMVTFLKYGGSKVAEGHLQSMFEVAKQKTKELLKLL